MQRLAGVGLLTALGGGMYGLHPALAGLSDGRMAANSGSGFAAEHAAAERALLAAYAAFGDWLLEQIQTGAAEMAFALIERQRRTMGRLLGLALASDARGGAELWSR